jgi:hypothetical protein
MTTDKEAKEALDSLTPYLIVVRNAPPQSILSSVNLIDQYYQQVEEHAAKQEYWKPIRLVDEEGKITAVYAPDAILAIVQGVIRAEVKQEPNK